MSYSAIVAVLLLAVLVAIAIGPAAIRALARRSPRGGGGRARDETTVLEVAAIERLYGREQSPHPVRAKPRGDVHDDR